MLVNEVNMAKEKQPETIEPTCLFCDKPKTWRSDVRIVVGRRVITEATVCPSCRKEHTIQEVYDASIERDLKALEKALSNAGGE